MYVPAGNAAPDPDGTNSVGNPNVGPATLLLAMYPEVPIAVAVVPDDPRGLVTDGLAVDFNKLNTCTPLAMRSAVLYTSDAADERSSVDLGGRRIIKKK